MMAPRKFADFTSKVSAPGPPPIASLSIIQFVVFSVREHVRTEPLATTPMFKVPSRPRPWTKHLKRVEVNQKPRRKHLRRDPPEETPDSGEEGALHHEETAGPGPEPG